MEFVKSEIELKDIDFKDIKKEGTNIFEKEILKPINDERTIEEILEMSIVDESIDGKSIEFIEKEDSENLSKEIEGRIESLTAEDILELSEKYPKVYSKLIASEKSIINDLQSIQSNPEKAGEILEAVDSKIGKFKGDLMEAIIKETLSDRFDNILDKEQQVDIGDGKKTNIDATCEKAKEDFKIGDVEVNKGENLYIESKIGKGSYIRDEMGHMLDQVKGHHIAGQESGNDYKSIIVVSKDYLNISEEKRTEFEEKLKELGTSIVILDKNSSDIENKVTEVIGGLH